LENTSDEEIAALPRMYMLSVAELARLQRSMGIHDNPQNAAPDASSASSAEQQEANHHRGEAQDDDDGYDGPIGYDYGDDDDDSGNNNNNHYEPLSADSAVSPCPPAATSSSSSSSSAATPNWHSRSSAVAAATLMSTPNENDDDTRPRSRPTTPTLVQQQALTRRKADVAAMLDTLQERATTSWMAYDGLTAGKMQQVINCIKAFTATMDAFFVEEQDYTPIPGDARPQRFVLQRENRGSHRTSASSASASSSSSSAANDGAAICTASEGYSIASLLKESTKAKRARLATNSGPRQVIPSLDEIIALYQPVAANTWGAVRIGLVNSTRPTLNAVARELGITNAHRNSKATLVDEILQVITYNGAFLPEWHATIGDVAHLIVAHDQSAIGARVFLSINNGSMGVSDENPLHGYMQQRDGSWSRVENLPVVKLKRLQLNAASYA